MKTLTKLSVSIVVTSLTLFSSIPVFRSYHYVF